MSKEGWMCLGCLNDQEADGISINGYEPEVCSKCWAEVPVHWRILMYKLLDTHNGELSRIALHLETLELVARKLFHAHHGHDPIQACMECDPQGAERLARYRREGKPNG